MNVKGLVQNHALLAVLELQRAGISLVKMVAAGIVITILVVSAWMGLVAAAVVWAVGAGANWGVALLVAAIAALIVIIVFALGGVIKDMFDNTCDTIASKTAPTLSSCDAG